MAFSKSTSARPRAATSFSRHTVEEEDDDDEEPGSGGKRKGMPPIHRHKFSSIPSNQGTGMLQVAKLRPAKSVEALAIDSNWARDVSISTAMSRLKVGDDDSVFSTSASEQSSILSGIHQLESQSSSQALVKFDESHYDSMAPKTPSRIPVLKTEAFQSAIPVTPL